MRSLALRSGFLALAALVLSWGFCPCAMSRALAGEDAPVCPCCPENGSDGTPHAPDDCPKCQRAGCHGQLPAAGEVVALPSPDVASALDFDALPRPWCIDVAADDGEARAVGPPTLIALRTVVLRN